MTFGFFSVNALPNYVRVITVVHEEDFASGIHMYRRFQSYMQPLGQNIIAFDHKLHVDIDMNALK